MMVKSALCDSHGIDAMRYLTADANVSWVFGEIDSDKVAYD